MADKQVKDALKVQGCQTKYKLINGTYERMPHDHNGKAAFVTRDATPCYCFHTGKARWVISKRIDDGQRCYAFKKDDDQAELPWLTKGPWVLAGDDGNWSPDASVTDSKVPGSNDIFVQLRLSLEKEMTDLGLVETDSLKQLWRRLDFNGNNVVSLAEFDKLVVEMVDGGAWPSWLNNKPALMRAFEKAKAGVDGKRGDFVEKCEFHDLLLNMFWFNKLWKVYEDIDKDGDRRMSKDEFKQGMSKLGLERKLSDSEADSMWNQIDADHGGMVLFVEFCSYVRKRVHPDDNPSFDAAPVSGEKAARTLQKKHGSQITQTHAVVKKNFQMFEKIEPEFQSVLKDNDQAKLKEWWQHLDFNGNNEVSLAEIDKWVVENYEVLNHKPALMRAYKLTLEQQPKTKYPDFVHKHGFKILLTNLFYFNKIFWVFDQVDNDKDRRLDFKEFKQVLTLCGAPMSQQQARQEFQKVDRNGGGIILFDEFCLYFTEANCPQSMTDFVDEK